jgi:hypothetical protein
MAFQESNDSEAAFKAFPKSISITTEINRFESLKSLFRSKIDVGFTHKIPEHEVLHPGMKFGSQVCIIVSGCKILFPGI